MIKKMEFCLFFNELTKPLDESFKNCKNRSTSLLLVAYLGKDV